MHEIMHGLKVPSFIHVGFILSIKLGMWVLIVEAFPEMLEEVI